MDTTSLESADLAPARHPTAQRTRLTRGGLGGQSPRSIGSTIGRRGWSPRRLWIIALLVLLGGAVWFGRSWHGAAGAAEPLIYYTVSRSDLPITVTERGNLESQRNTEIRCEVETVTGTIGTRIMFLVPNGSQVKAGDLIAEFESGLHKDRLDNQVVTYEQAKATQIQATARFENQKTQNATNLAAAELKVKLAELDLKMYEDGEDGTYQIARQELELKVQEARNQITGAQAALLMQQTARNGMETLYKLGYRGKGDLDQASYKSLQAEDTLVKATNGLATAVSSRKKLEQFEHPMKKLTLEGALNTARQALVQVQRDNQSLLAQAEAAKIAADQSLAKEKEKLDKYAAQIEKCRIFAPHDGMVAYAERTAWGHVIAEGIPVGERMRFLTLPDLTRMQVKTAVHESALDQVKKGHRATVRIDAFPDRTYNGTVQTVAVMPAPATGNMSTDVKVYETIVTIADEVEHLKPGMTAVVEIHVDRLEDVLCVPVQAVVQDEQETCCYVDGLAGLERRPVRLGRTNDKFVQIVAGLDGGERVLLNPMSIVDEETHADRSISPHE